MSMMDGMMQQMQTAATHPNQPNSMYCSTSVTSITADGGGGPARVYQSSSTTQQLGNRRQTTRTLQDSVSGRKEMTVSRQLGDRQFVKERKDNLLTGDSQVREWGMDGDSLPHFEHEFFHSSIRPSVGHPRIMAAPAAPCSVTIEELSSSEDEVEQQEQQRKQQLEAKRRQARKSRAKRVRRC